MSDNYTEVDYNQTEDLYDNLVYAVDSIYISQRSTIPSSTSQAMKALTDSYDELHKDITTYREILSTDVENVWKSVKTLIDCDEDVTEYIRGKMVGFPVRDAYKDELPTE